MRQERKSHYQRQKIGGFNGFQQLPRTGARELDTYKIAIAAEKRKTISTQQPCKINLTTPTAKTTTRALAHARTLVRATQKHLCSRLRMASANSLDRAGSTL